MLLQLICIKRICIIFLFVGLDIYMASAQKINEVDAPLNLKDRVNAAAAYINVYRHGDRFFFEVPDSTLGKDILIVSRIVSASQGVSRSSLTDGGYPGAEMSQKIIRFEKDVANGIVLKSVGYEIRSNDSSANGMSAAVKNINNSVSILKFKSIITTTDQTASIIDVTELLKSDNEVFFINTAKKTSLQVGNFQPELSHVLFVHAFRENIEIRTRRNYSNLTNIELNTSLLLLPVKPMHPRYANPKVGYFTKTVIDFDQATQGHTMLNMITRWRLELKPEDLNKYDHGELVEPVKPIIFFIDPATPLKWVKYIKAGVDDWQSAFEQAGFKNAISGKIAPTKELDTSWDLFDIRNSVIDFLPSLIKDANYSTVVDPRSGEILQSHILWSEGEMRELRNTYMIQASPSDQRAHGLIFSDSLMGTLVRIMISHEVGHTLGFPHNWGASASVPVEKLRQKNWVESHGISPSVMDYARFNYVAQPKDAVKAIKGLTNGIGDYDKWAIAWGYRLAPGNLTVAQENDWLGNWARSKSTDRKYWYGGERDGDDPRIQTEDLGDDAMAASYYGISNLKFVLVHLPQWVESSGGGFDDLNELFEELVKEYTQYMGHVTKNVGGIYESFEGDGDAVLYLPVPIEVQKRAIVFLGKELFKTPNWLLNKNVLDRLGINGFDLLDKLQTETLDKLLSFHTAANLLSYGRQANGHYYTLTGLFDDLRQRIFSEINYQARIILYRQCLQERYVNRVCELFEISKLGTGRPEIREEGTQLILATFAQIELRQLQKLLNKGYAVIKDKQSRVHLKYLLKKIDVALSKN